MGQFSKGAAEVGTGTRQLLKRGVLKPAYIYRRGLFSHMGKAPKQSRHFRSFGCCNREPARSSWTQPCLCRSGWGTSSPSLAFTCCSRPSRRMVSVTSVPGCVPATRLRKTLGSLTAVPLNEVITSPFLRPARSADQNRQLGRQRSGHGVPPLQVRRNLLKLHSPVRRQRFYSYESARCLWAIER